MENAKVKVIIVTRSRIRKGSRVRIRCSGKRLDGTIVKLNGLLHVRINGREFMAEGLRGDTTQGRGMKYIATLKPAVTSIRAD